MKKHLTKRRVLIGLAVVALAIGAGAGYAYFTSGGTGSGSASVGSSEDFTVEQVAPLPGDLLPGAAAQNVNVTVTNPASFDQRLTAVTITLDEASLPPGCLAEWFTVTSPVAGVPVTLQESGTAGDSVDLTGTIAMEESGGSQDACQGADLDLVITAS